MISHGPARVATIVLGRQAWSPDLKPITSWHDPAARQQFKLLAVETDKTEQKLIAESLNLLFAKYSKPTIAS
jgi:hypothetical protein